MNTERIFYQTETPEWESSGCRDKTELDIVQRVEDSKIDTDRKFYHALLDEWLDWAVKQKSLDNRAIIQFYFCQADHTKE